MCACSEFQVAGAETENAREVKLLIMPEGLARRFVLQERKALDGRISSAYRIPTFPMTLSDFQDYFTYVQVF